MNYISCSYDLSHGDGDDDVGVLELDREVVLSGDERSRRTMPNDEEFSPVAQQREQFQSSERAQRRILVVDDNVDAANILSELLRVMGYDVSTEFHPNAALTRTTSEKFDAFLLDIGLPEIDGHQLARQLRARSSAANALYVAVTGYNNEEDRRRSAEAGFHHHFGKPVNLAALLAALGPPGLPSSDT